MHIRCRIIIAAFAIALVHPVISTAAAASSSTAAPKTIKLPSALILEGRLSKVISSHFTEKTLMHTQLGDTEVEPIDVVVAADTYLQNYYLRYFKRQPQMEPVLQGRVPSVIKAVLQDFPLVLEELAASGELK